VLSALASNTKVNVISSPHIMVTDNQVARINVGSSVPVQGQSTITGVTTSTAITTSVQYVDTGVLLSVRPHINSGGLVTMEISQEVSDVQAGVTTTGLNSPTINKRSAQTTVAVQSGDTMVLVSAVSATQIKEGQDWFPEVMGKGVYVSDVFMGFRKFPHFVIAVCHRSAGGVCAPRTVEWHRRNGLNEV
jgi:general secretion pathway protein D